MAHRLVDLWQGWRIVGEHVHTADAKAGGSRVNREIFYRKLVAALLHAGFHLQAGDVSKGDASTERSAVLSNIRNAVEAAVPLQVDFDRDVIQRHLDMVREWAAVACFKYTLGQPVMVAVVEADRLADQEIIELAKRFDQVIVEMLDVSAKMVIGPGSVRMSSTGVILLVFFDLEAASLFVGSTQKKCKIQHLWKKTWILPWVVDVPNKTVSRHRGLPFLMSAMLNKDDLQKEIFQADGTTTHRTGPA